MLNPPIPQSAAIRCAPSLWVPGPRRFGIGYGGMHLSIDGRPPEAEAIRAMHASLDAGVTLIDTANVYCLE